MTEEILKHRTKFFKFDERATLEIFSFRQNFVDSVIIFLKEPCIMNRAVTTQYFTRERKKLKNLSSYFLCNSL